MKLNNIKAFTLAEVLITLTIIGVIAAITIAQVNVAPKGKIYRIQLMKSISNLSQVAKMNKAVYGWDYADIDTSCVDYNTGKGYTEHRPDETYSMCALLNGSLTVADFATKRQGKNYLVNYQINPPTATITIANQEYMTYVLADGSIVGFRGSAMRLYGCHLEPDENYDINKIQHKYCSGFIDVNGNKPPNKETLCSLGTTSSSRGDYCVVYEKDIKDIYPVFFHDDVVEIGSNAGRYVMEHSEI